MSQRMTLAASAPVSAMRAGSLLHIKSHRLIDILFVFGLVIFPITTFLALVFWFGSTTGMASEPGIFLLPP